MVEKEEWIKQNNLTVKNTEEYKLGSKGLNLMMKETKEIPEFDYSQVFVLDTGATFHSVRNKSLLTGIHTPCLLYTSPSPRD